MRLGCDVTAVDINPVAWFILKCTLEYPQRLANQQLPLPAFACQSREFMESYFKAKGFKDAALRVKLASLGLDDHTQTSTQPELLSLQTEITSVEADLAWHVRAWGWWVLQQAKADLARFYPTIDDKPTVAYLWARTVTCKNCRATVPLLKTRWLCQKDKKRVVLSMESNVDKTGVVFGIQEDVPLPKGTVAQRKETDKQAGKGTMSRTGVTCPCCETVMPKEDIQREGVQGRLGAVLTAVVIDGPTGKEYRLPTFQENQLPLRAENELNEAFLQIPFGLPTEPLTLDAKGNTWCILYGVNTFQKLFTSRQLFALGKFVKYTRIARDAMRSKGYSEEWTEAVSAYLACAVSRLLDYCNNGVQWKLDATTINHFFVRFAVPISWDYAEGNTIGDSAGSYKLCYERICTALDTYAAWDIMAPIPEVMNASATMQQTDQLDVILTDPPYYDSIGYAVIMDFFYVWLRRILYGLSPEIDAAFQEPLSPKWDHEHNDGELIDEASRFGGDKQKVCGGWKLAHPDRDGQSYTSTFVSSTRILCLARLQKAFRNGASWLG